MQLWIDSHSPKHTDLVGSSFKYSGLTSEETNRMRLHKSSIGSVSKKISEIYSPLYSPTYQLNIRFMSSPNMTQIEIQRKTKHWAVSSNFLPPEDSVLVLVVGLDLEDPHSNPHSLNYKASDLGSDTISDSATLMGCCTGTKEVFAPWQLGTNSNSHNHFIS